jgi:hypothetical protein
MMRTLIAGGVFLGVCAYGACSSSGGGSVSGTGGAGGASPQITATGGSPGGLGGTTATRGSAAGSGGASLAGGTGGSGGGSGGSTFPNVGVCGESGNATADATSYDGHEVRYIIGEQGFGTKICQVQFDLKRVGDAPPGCTECTWTHLLEYSNPSVITDTDGVCAESDLALDTAAIAKIVGSRVAIGFAEHYGGAHASARMTYFEATNTWDVVGNANWSETTKAFSYDFRDGYCNYGP